MKGCEVLPFRIIRQLTYVDLTVTPEHSLKALLLTAGDAKSHSASNRRQTRYLGANLILSLVTAWCCITSAHGQRWNISLINLLWGLTAMQVLVTICLRLLNPLPSQSFHSCLSYLSLYHPSALSRYTGLVLSLDIRWCLQNKRERVRIKRSFYSLSKMMIQSRIAMMAPVPSPAPTIRSTSVQSPFMSHWQTFTFSTEVLDACGFPESVITMGTS